MLPNGKFVLREDKRTGRLSIRDVETRRELFLDDKKDVKKLVDLMNDGYLIIKDKWGV